jgi:hypothetical protein
MGSRLNLMNLNSQRMKRLKTLAKLLGKSRLFRETSVTVVHNFSHYEQGREYIFEPLEDGRRALIRGHGSNVQLGDYLILSHGKGSVRYQVEDIEHYVGSSPLWIAIVRLHSGSAAADQQFWMGPARPSCEPALTI